MPDLLVIPSIDVSEEFTSMVPGVEVYEQRLLCSLFRLQHENQRVFYVTSKKVSEASINYLLSLVPNTSFESAKKRLFMFSCDGDTSDKNLSEKLLGASPILQEIKQELISSEASIECYMHTPLEDQIATLLGVTYISMPNEIANLWGTKFGSRLCFDEIGIPHARGSHRNLTCVEHVIEELVDICTNHTEVRKVIVKLNEGVSGLGNAELVLPDRIAFGKLSTTESLLEYLEANLVPCSGGAASDFLSKIPTTGAIVEEMIEHQQLGSPSVQGIISEIDGTVEIVSTHEQLLAHQVYQGCYFPAPVDCRLMLQEYGKLVGNYLSKKGASGHFGVDFVTWKETCMPGAIAKTSACAIEINLRHLGTTHPLQTLQLLTGGKLDLSTGLFLDPRGKALYYIATDCFRDEEFKKISSQEFADLVHQYPSELEFDSQTHTGPVFHMLDCLEHFGKIGLMYIGDSEQVAQDGFERTKAFVRSLLLGASGRAHAAASLGAARPEVRLARPGVAEGAAPLARRLLITVAVHGDEQCGLEAVRSLARSGFFHPRDLWARHPGLDEVVIAVGNPAAVEANRRFVDCNLNRVMCGPGAHGVEGGLVGRMRDLIDASGWYLDLHSTSSPSKPFAIPAPSRASFATAEAIGVEFVLEGLLESLQGTTLHWAARDAARVGLVVECGQHEWPSSAQFAACTIRRFLEIASFCGQRGNEDLRALPCRRAHQVLQCRHRQPLRPGFRYSREPPRAFQFVNGGEALAEDCKGEISCPYPQGAFLIMPTAKSVVGEEAWFWGVASEGVIWGDGQEAQEEKDSIVSTLSKQ